MKLLDVPFWFTKEKSWHLSLICRFFWLRYSIGAFLELEKTEVPTSETDFAVIHAFSLNLHLLSFGFRPSIAIVSHTS